MEKILNRYGDDNPPVNIEVDVKLKITNPDSGYANLDGFLDICKKILEIDKKFAKKTDYPYLDEKGKKAMQS